jgi:excisionase family DNA binding protein
MRLLTAKETAVVLNIPLQRVYELARQKILPTVVLGERQIRFDEDALRQWIARGGYVQSDKNNEQGAR